MYISVYTHDHDSALILMATTSVSFTHLCVYDEFACANSMLLD